MASGRPVRVAGLGPAGAWYTMLLAERGVEVEAYDARRRYDKPCGEAVPARWVVGDWLLRANWSIEMMRVEPPVVDRIRSVAIAYVDAGGWLVDYEVDDPGHRVGYVVDKQAWIEKVIERAERRGARIRRGEPLRPRDADVVACGGSCVPPGEGPRVDARAVVFQCYAARSSLLSWIGVDAVIVFSPAIRGPGYAWAWRAGAGRVNAGVGWIGWSPRPGDGEELARALLGLDGRCAGSYSAITWRRPPKTWEQGGRVYIGEAAGMVTPMAEGIRPAILSALAAAYDDRELWRRLRRLAGGPLWRRMVWRLASAANRSRRMWRRLASAREPYRVAVDPSPLAVASAIL